MDAEAHDNGTGDFRNEMADEYKRDEGIAFPKSSVHHRKEYNEKNKDRPSKFK